MKKIKLLLIPILFLVSISVVKADTENITSSYYYSVLPESYTYLTTYSTEIQGLIDYWNTNSRSYSSDYVIFYSNNYYFQDGKERIVLIPLTSHNVTFRHGSVDFIFTNAFKPNGDAYMFSYIIDDAVYDFTSSTFNTSFGNFTLTSVPMTSSLLYYVKDSGSSGVDTIVFPSYLDSNNNIDIPSITVESGYYFPNIADVTDPNYEPNPNADYVEVDLTQYDYVVLSLKDYATTQEFSTIYVYGQLCLTPVYNYGMVEKNQFYSGYQTQGCSITYPEFTPNKVYILDEDKKNHAVYYINNRDNNLQNKIKFDANFFDISYINSSNAENPTVTVNGRSYPIIPYSDLTDTAIISTNEGYISGVSCPIGDINCYADYANIDIDDLFTNPLKFLKSIWGSITGVLVVIASFIIILPPTLQAFMFTAFILALALGVLKILL